MRERSWLLAPLLLAVVVNLGALSTELVFDDTRIIEGNHELERLSDIPHHFTRDAWSGSGEHSRLWRPLLRTSLTIDRTLFGPSALAFRATNLALHVAVCAALLSLLLALGCARADAGLATALFAVHPTHVEVLASAFNRSESMGTLACLLAAGAVARHATRRPARALSVAAACMVVGLLCRENVVALPALVALGLWLPPPEERAGARTRILVPLVLGSLVIAYAVARHVALGEHAPAGVAGYLPPQPAAGPSRAASVLEPLASYARLLLVPTGLKVDYAGAGIVRGGVWLAGAAALHGLALGVALWFRRRAWRMSLAIGWFYVALLPSTKIFADPAILAERFLYLPSVALAIAVAAGLPWLRERAGTRLAHVLLAVLAIGFSARTLERAADWQSNVSLWRAELAVNPGSLLARHQLGIALLRVGQPAEAEALLADAIRRGLSSTRVHDALGGARAMQGHWADADRAFAEGLARAPDDVPLRLNYALMLLRSGDAARAVPILERAATLAPGDARLRSLLEAAQAAAIPR